MIRSAVDFKAQAESRGLGRWSNHDCSFCGYPTGWIFDEGGVWFDSGCYCSSYGPRPPRPSSWDEVAEHYNRNQPENNSKISPEWVATTDVFWGFVEVDA